MGLQACGGGGKWGCCPFCHGGSIIRGGAGGSGGCIACGNGIDDGKCDGAYGGPGGGGGTINGGGIIYIGIIWGTGASANSWWGWSAWLSGFCAVNWNKIVNTKDDSRL